MTTVRWEEDPTSHRWWVWITTNILRQRDAAYAREYGSCNGPPWQPPPEALAKIRQDYYPGILVAYRKHRPLGPLVGEAIPNEVAKALELGP